MIPGTFQDSQENVMAGSGSYCGGEHLAFCLGPLLHRVVKASLQVQIVQVNQKNQWRQGSQGAKLGLSGSKCGSHESLGLLRHGVEEALRLIQVLASTEMESVIATCDALSARHRLKLRLLEVLHPYQLSAGLYPHFTEKKPKAQRTK